MQYLHRYKLLIFSLIGVFNTLFDIALYTILRDAGQSLVTANLISASAALIGSYFLNSRLTFKSKKWSTHTFVYFVVVTLFGLWVLQTGAIYVISHLITKLPVAYWSHFGKLAHTATLAIPKLLATTVTFAWNYVWYNKVIFKSNSKAENIITSLD